MRIQPDSTGAAADQASAIRLLREVLRPAVAGAGLGTDERILEILEGDGTFELLAYPGLFAAAFEVQSRRRGNDLRSAAALLGRVGEEAAASAARARRGVCPAWKVDLPPPQPHLEESVERAKSQIPPRPDRADEVARLHVRGWTPEDRSVHCAASCVLGDVWPEMLAEIATVVRQVALMEGFGIEGFTDFTSHGAVFLNSARLGVSADGLPPPVRLAEGLVHEATHNRCNAAALSHPFLAGDGADPATLVHTPLRSDPRPLNGLFQQLVVIVRCSLLYGRLLERDAGNELRARRQTLLDQGRQAVATLRAHSAKLSDHGREVLDEAEALLHGDALLVPTDG